MPFIVPQNHIQSNQRTPHDLYHTQQMKTYDTIGAQDKVEGRFVDSITPLEHDRIIFEHTELLLESAR